jgi:hypothetical protein
MSKGPGRIERAIGDILDGAPESAFTAEELCRRVYDLDPFELGAVWKQHRVAVIRAGKRLAERRPEIDWRRSEGRASEIIFFRRDNAVSYQVGWLKSGYHHSNHRRRTDEEFRQMIKPSERCWPVERFIAQRNGDTEKLDQLDAEAKREFAEAKREFEIREMRLRSSFGR